ncbi:MAG: hypothetical protein K0U41_06970 [Gammaproteobacteria bacterium]|nr:hypothetical protein [Gammaproteobacteria bacterium]
MSKLQDLAINADVTGISRVAGTKPELNNESVNFLINDIGDFFARTGQADPGRLSLTWQRVASPIYTDNPSGIVEILDVSGAADVAFEDITQLIVSNTTFGDVAARDIINLYVGSLIKIHTPQLLTNVYGLYSVTSVRNHSVEGYTLINVVYTSGQGTEVIRNSDYIAISSLGVSMASVAPGFDIVVTGQDGNTFDVTSDNTAANPVATTAYVDAQILPPVIPTSVFGGRLTGTADDEVPLSNQGEWTIAVAHNTGWTYVIHAISALPTGWISATATDLQSVMVLSATTATGTEELSQAVTITGTATETSSGHTTPFTYSATLRTFIPWFRHTTGVESSAALPLFSTFIDQGRLDAEELVNVDSGNNRYVFIAIPTTFGTPQFRTNGFISGPDAINAAYEVGYTIYTFGPITSAITTTIEITR